MTPEALVHPIPADLARQFVKDLRIVLGDIKPGMLVVNEGALKEAGFMEALKAGKLTLVAVPTSSLAHSIADHG